MAMQIIPNDVQIQGDLYLTGDVQPALARTSLLQQDAARLKVPLENFRVWDAYQTVLPGTAATDDLALIGGTFGTAHPSIQSGDLKAAGATTRYARTVLHLPWHYVAAQTVTVRIHGGMLTTAADTSATIDVEAYRHDEDTTLTGSDICATAAQSINSLTFAPLDFAITATTLQPGDSLDILLAMTVTDGATGTAVIGCVGAVELLLDVKG